MFEKPISPGTQLLLFVCIYLFSWFISGLVIAIFVLSTSNAEVAEIDITDPATYLISVLVTQLVNFLLAFWIFLRITGQKVGEIILFTRKFDRRLLLVTFVVFISAMPIMYGLAWINGFLTDWLPMSDLIDGEREMNLAHEKVLAHSNIGRLLLSIIILAALPAFAEEIIFRGFLQGRMHLATGSSHFAVVISSIIFAGLHFQPLKLLPMIFLALCLGYLYRYTKDIKYSMILHFSINGIQIVAYYFAGDLMRGF